MHPRTRTAFPSSLSDVLTWPLRTAPPSITLFPAFSRPPKIDRFYLWPIRFKDINSLLILSYVSKACFWLVRSTGILSITKPRSRSNLTRVLILYFVYFDHDFVSASKISKAKCSTIMMAAILGNWNDISFIYSSFILFRITMDLCQGVNIA